jgi:hypothetical protein
MPAEVLSNEDLQVFKYELIDEIKKLLRQNGIQPVKKWIKSAEVCNILGISTGTLRTLRIKGELTFSRIGGVNYYDYDDIQQMLLENKK